jgi:ribosomal-protein-alanine N-acetyltransferase
MTRLRLRYMTLADIAQVVTIDRAAFSTPWSARTYAYEVTQSDYTHMVVLEKPFTRTPVSGLRRMFRNLLMSSPPTYKILAYGGLWRILEEAHISTIASHPEWRGKGYGELTLAAMIQRAITLSANYVGLEVRVSNVKAQTLYFKYGFSIMTTKPRYYRDNHEDAYEMRLALTTSLKREFSATFAALCHKHHCKDDYTTDQPLSK